MVESKESKCLCGGKMQYYDTVKRKVKGKYGSVSVRYIQRNRCLRCGSVKRLLPADILPFKRYSADVIFGVLEGIITCETLGFEDYPCETTMQRWFAYFANTIMKGVY